MAKKYEISSCNWTTSLFGIWSVYPNLSDIFNNDEITKDITNKIAEKIQIDEGRKDFK